MAFSVEDFPDLMRLLEEHPEWRAELRRLLLPEELLGLPAAVRELAEQVQALARTVGELAEAQRRTEGELGALRQTVGELAEAQRRTEGELGALRQTVGELAEAQRHTEGALGALVEAQRRTNGRLDQLERHVADLRGSDFERRYREHAGGYFGRLLRRVRVVRAEELDALLEEGVSAGTLDEDSTHDLRLADLIVRGRRPGEDEDTYVVVEVSVGIGLGDVERAERRASLLSRLRPTLAMVAGERLRPEAEQAAARQVWRLLDGQILGPNET